MHTQVLILSADAVFARMLTLELEMQRISAANRPSADGHTAEVVLLDLDTATPPDSTTYRQMIGFGTRSAAAGDEAGRLCSLVLRRPFEMRVLCAEVSKLLKSGTDEQAEPPLLILNPDGVILSDGRRVAVSPKERAVLELLLQHRGEPVSREMISAAIGESSANKADVYVCYLRKKLETSERRVIRTVRGKGYQLI